MKDPDEVIEEVPRGGQNCYVWPWQGLTEVLKEAEYYTRQSHYHYTFKGLYKRLDLFSKIKNIEFKTMGGSHRKSRFCSYKENLFKKQRFLKMKLTAFNSQLTNIFKCILIANWFRKHIERIHFEFCYIKLFKTLLWHKKTQHIFHLKVLNTRRGCLKFKSLLSSSFLTPISIFR